MNKEKAQHIIDSFFKTPRSYNVDLPIEKEFSKSCCAASWFSDDDRIQVKLRNFEGEANATSPAMLPSLLDKSKFETTNFPTSKENAINIPGHVFHGCKHYIRNCKILCPVCERFFPCRICHDKVSDHELDRFAVKHVFCFNCETIVPIAEKCSNCKESFGCYYCDKCKFINGNTFFQAYHCDECNLCRVGRREDAYHCKICRACYTQNSKTSHPCRQDSALDNCPVCRCPIINSRKPVWAGPCGHYMHSKCVIQLFQFNHFRCSICKEPLISADQIPKDILGKDE